MPQVGQARATLDDLYREPGKAELIDGRIVRFMATGYLPNRVAFRIARSLDDHSESIGRGVAFTDNIGFAVPELISGRESFSQDASYYDGPLPENRMRFISGPPTRSEGDYDAAAEGRIVAKRADYFAAGTRTVWDVDPVAEEVRVYWADGPASPAVFRRGDDAHAEPAVPGWHVSVDWIFG
jgi:Uma2 family endonuclease